MRLLPPALGIAALALAGIALAQPRGVVDPWGRASDEAGSWFAPSAPAEGDRAAIHAELKDPWAKASETNASPVVVPLGPVDAVLDVGPIDRAPARRPEPLVLDPWSPVIASEFPSLASDAKPAGVANSATRARWAERVVEIVDPWRRLPEWNGAERVRLVVDPWAR